MPFRSPLSDLPVRSFRVWLSVVTVLVVMLALGAGIWYFAFGVTAALPASVRVAGLTEPVTIHWMESGAADIEARGEADAYLALGFAQATRAPWLLVLLRDTALGRLSAVFGTAYHPLDRFIRTLQFERLSRAAYARLPSDERRLLQAFSQGVNSALDEAAVRLTPEFVLLDLTEPLRWEPWHVLAVERLHAWLATTPAALAPTVADARAVRTLHENDRLLRTWLHLYGLDLSFAGALNQDGTPTLFVQYVGGASALPFVLETVIHGLAPAPVQAAALPGTPFFLSGATASHAWVVLPAAPLSVEPIAPSTRLPGTAHERIRTSTGDERLVTFTEVDTSHARLPIGAPGAPPAAYLNWSGFSPSTDWPAWRRLVRGEAPGFRLLTGSGLLLRPGRSPDVFGTPDVVEASEQSLLIGHTPRAALLAERLHTLTRSTTAGASNRLDDCYSPWAALMTPALIDGLPAATEMPLLQREALTYLRNWDHYFGPSSIGASIFSVLTSELDLGHTSSQTAAPALPSSETLLRAWVDAVDSLYAGFGPDPEQWRWEIVNPTRLYFPVWSSPLDTPDAPPSTTARYAPAVFPGRGDLTTLCRGSVPADYGLDAVLSWEAVLAPGPPPRLLYRRYGIDVAPFLGRSLATEPADITHALPSPYPSTATTHLVPSDRD